MVRLNVKRAQQRSHWSAEQMVQELGKPKLLGHRKLLIVSLLLQA